MIRRTVTAILIVATCWMADWTVAPCPADETAPQADGVMPWRLPEQTDPEIRKIQDRIYQLVQKQARYLLSTVHPWSDDPELKLLTESRSLEHWIRPNGATLQGLSFLYRFGPYDEKVVGVSRKALLEQTIIPMMRYLAATHVTGPRPTSDGKKWGNHWQSAYWAQYLARAASWTWDDLPQDVRQQVRTIVAHEAGRFVNETPPHQLKADTKAEENAWNSMIFDVAVILMPSDPRRADWEKAFQRWALSSYLRPADEHSDKLVDGRPVSAQFTGANIYDDFTLENHRKVHPDYMGAFTLTQSCALDHQMTGRKPPEAVFHNTREIYENLKWFFLPDGGCVYPNGEDWELFANIPGWMDMHVQMAVYRQDPDAWPLLLACLATTEKMQARHPDGSIHAREESFYPGLQHGSLEDLSRVWLMLQGAERIVNRPQPLRGVKRLESGKLILNRTPRAVHTFSWGPVVMAQCVPLRLDRVVSPDDRSGVGHVLLKNEKKTLPVRLESANVSEDTGGFVAELVIDHGDALRAALSFRSNADGTFLLREQLTALRDCDTSQIATGLIGILNNPRWVFESHSRRIQFDGQVADIPALSGKVMEGDGGRRIDVDGALRIEAAAPLRAHYAGTRKTDRGRATDALYLNYHAGERHWSSGQVVSSYEVTVTPANEFRESPVAE